MQLHHGPPASMGRFTNTTAGHNKWWEYRWWTDGTLITKYGKIGYVGQTYEKTGQKAFDVTKLVDSKVRKGYVQDLDWLTRQQSQQAQQPLPPPPPPPKPTPKVPEPTVEAPAARWKPGVAPISRKQMVRVRKR
jgi:predicted DNA-binding WGR domain protein